MDPIQLHVILYTDAGIHVYSTDYSVTDVRRVDSWTDRRFESVMPGFHHSVAVLPLPFRRCR